MAKLRKEKEVNPILQKTLLLLFGIGPIALMIIFLASKGFFETSNL
tara:strand:- start:950 stop:1087 length:138 start_codon:yes stop_codon:yes gene_type:complete